MTLANLGLHGRNPDVLTCIANLSNDEVFTPPEFANRMLDTLEAAWAEDNAGASIWSNPGVRFLDPFTKSGVFLREITKRLTEGLASAVPDLGERVDHILTRQVFGIGVTQLTALLARRSIYCSKWANGERSIARSFKTDSGNIWFERVEHEWVDRKRERRIDPVSAREMLVEVKGTGKCRWCPATEQAYGRGMDLETYAYALIHTDNPRKLTNDMFGADMQFDVVVGNPPYQLKEDNSGEGNSASPIYQKFVLAAQALEPRYVLMVTPTRWIAGGKGLDDYRAAMLSDRRLSHLVDYADPSEVFPGVNIRGGVSYFLWDRMHNGLCQVTTIKGGEKVTAERWLDEFDVFVKDIRAVGILRKVMERKEDSLGEMVSARNPFGLGTNFYRVRDKAARDDLTIYYIKNRKRAVGFVSPEEVTKNRPAIKSWKVLAPYGGTDGSATPDSVLTRPIVAPPQSVCTDSFLFIPVESEEAAKSLTSYYSTRFFRFLVSLRKITQHAGRDTYSWVPKQDWNKVWTDSELNEKYGFSEEEVAYIDSVIRPMDLLSGAEDGSTDE